ncbi:MAG: hypothetical protein RL670_1292 [Actinomycetota bacterium]|jgi:apolipoprotein N-acyltransferase
MTKRTDARYKEQLRMFLWSLGITVVSVLFVLTGFYWLHSILLIAIGVALGPISAFVALFMGLMVLASRIKSKK